MVLRRLVKAASAIRAAAAMTSGDAGRAVGHKRHTAVQSDDSGIHPGRREEVARPHGEAANWLGVQPSFTV